MPRSVDLYVRLLHHLLPFGEIALEECGERGRCAGLRDIHRLLLEGGFDVRTREGLFDGTGETARCGAAEARGRTR